jgi:hypothetical protein
LTGARKDKAFESKRLLKLMKAENTRLMDLIIFVCDSLYFINWGFNMRREDNFQIN